jgi:hypothetical protein
MSLSRAEINVDQPTDIRHTQKTLNQSVFNVIEYYMYGVHAQGSQRFF